MSPVVSAIDAAWLRMEDPTNLMMVTGVLLFDGRVRQDRLRAVVEERLLAFQRFRQRVAEPPFGIGMPSWVDDDRFDLDAHLHRVALPEPADKAALETYVSDLMSTPLDFSKPLWQMHLVEHAGGSALVTRVHHAIADGIALVQVLLSLTDTTARPRRRRRGAAGPTLDAGAGASLLRAGGWLAHAGFGLLREPGQALRMAGFGADAAATLARVALLPPDPPTALKGPLGVMKRAAWSEPIPLAGVKAAGAHAGGTINDVLVATAAGALRRYVAGRGEDVDGLDVRATVPVNMRPLDQAHRLGNQFGLVFLALPLGIEDPVERLDEVKRRMDELKSSLQPVVALGALTAIGVLPVPLQPLPVQFFGSKASLVLTNVPGPRERLYLAGEPMGRAMFWVPQSGRLGLGVSVLSYAGEVMIGVASDAGLVPDPEAIVDGFAAELEALTAAAPSG
ncbi:MAG TPA: wax ester/triacylglycerol synthase family O-acyltransferase [Candidatus Dormibacteraeota bacterium]|nr:wax ester/triacylglycerol synthase family O-acyltransferase [Candidatus Dormibacteraeota bacterium]